MARWMLALIAVFAAVLVVVTLASGDAIYLIPAAILALILVGYAVAHDVLGRRVMARHEGDYGAAVSDEREPIPSAPDLGEDIRPAGDTPEVHDEISPHDLPPDHPGRQEAERQAGGPDGTTRGSVER